MPFLHKKEKYYGKDSFYYNSLIIFIVINAIFCGLLGAFHMWSEMRVVFPGVILTGISLYLFHTGKQKASKVVTSTSVIVIMVVLFFQEGGPLSYVSVFMTLAPSYLILIVDYPFHNKILIGFTTLMSLVSIYWYMYCLPSDISDVLRLTTVLMSLFTLSLGVIFGYHVSLIIDSHYRQKLEVMQSNQNLTSFIANISHELKTPLNGILGLQEMLTSDDLEEQNEEVLSLLKQSSLRMKKTINHVLELNKIKSNTCEVEDSEFNLDELIHEILSSYDHLIRNRQVDIIYDSCSKIIYSDRSKLKLILENIIENAIKFTTQGEVKIWSVFDAKQFQFFFQDNGQGILEENLSIIFEAYKHSSAKIDINSGAGLGLHVSNEMAELLNGFITVDSKWNEGSLFCLTLPLDREPITSFDHEGLREKPLQIMKILLVEDDIISQKVISSQFSKMGYHVSIANDGLGAFEYATKHHDELDVIFMDIQMPVMDGISSTKKIREWEIVHSKHTIPIIALTANTMYENKLLCYSNGLNYFMSKPFNPAKMKHIITKLESHQSLWT